MYWQWVLHVGMHVWCRIQCLRLTNTYEAKSVRLSLLAGTIPPCLGEGKALKWLFLENNQLSGPIPARFGHNLTALTRFQASGNNFTGELRQECW